MPRRSRADLDSESRRVPHRRRACPAPNGHAVRAATLRLSYRKPTTRHSVRKAASSRTRRSTSKTTIRSAVTGRSRVLRLVTTAMRAPVAMLSARVTTTAIAARTTALWVGTSAATRLIARPQPAAISTSVMAATPAATAHATTASPVTAASVTPVMNPPMTG